MNCTRIDVEALWESWVDRRLRLVDLLSAREKLGDRARALHDGLPMLELLHKFPRLEFNT